ncbi:hypothetical protein L1987_36970 [Smallanthus sonchifolius]|uniref:Uncharacterized protein n=1 Tax=Smallanthus sonchifolius TaxID=185202 RepID=A0ACB9HF20_9ASTR|nr:hypothetical protein L1987_36970 [Smallanthus sonchifolius]
MSHMFNRLYSDNYQQKVENFSTPFTEHVNRQTKLDACFLTPFKNTCDYRHYPSNLPYMKPSSNFTYIPPATAPDLPNRISASAAANSPIFLLSCSWVYCRWLLSLLFSGV